MRGGSRKASSGRRRRTYRLTANRRRALAEWRVDPETDTYELRDPGLLKLFAGADPAALAKSQLAAHEREYVRFWSGLRKSRPKP